MKTTKQIRSSVTKTTRTFYDEATLRKLLSLPTPRPGVAVRIFVEVPGGADWANTDLEIEDCGRGRPLIVEVIETSEEETEE